MRVLAAASIATAALVVGSLAPVAASAPVAAASDDTTATYTNPVSADFADTFADPAVVRGHDGWWYAVATTDPLLEGEGERHLLPSARSRDLVEWEYTGDAFTEDTLPAYADVANGASVWAPDLRYVDGQWRMYYVVTETTLTPELGDGAIGMATAPSPAGPWTDSGAPVVPPRPAPGGGFLWTFDPTHVTGPDGVQHLYYGSYFGGIEVVELDEAGQTAVGTPTRVAVDNAFEGAYVLQRQGFWYLFASSANCCAGPVTGYSVHVGRSDSPTGPFLDAQGNDLTASRTGGTPALVQNGNRWVGAGHNAVVSDLSGQDWIVYHAIDRDDPYLDGTDGINERPMLIDRMDWVDGWPVVDGGRGPSEDARPAPVATGADGFDDGLGRWDGAAAWTTTDSADTGGVAVATAAGSLTERVATTRSGTRLQASVRTPGTGAGLTAQLRDSSTVRAVVTDAGVLDLQRVDRRGRVIDSASAQLVGVDPADWHRLSLLVQDGVARAEISDVGLGDPDAVLQLDLPRRAAAVVRSAGVVALGAGAQVDDLSVVAAAVPQAPQPTAIPSTPDPVRSTEFDAPLEDGRWTALGTETQPQPPAEVRDGALQWDVEQGDLSGPGRTATLLLQDPPEGDWTVETSVDVSAFGTDEVRNFQQAGLVVRVDDDQWVRLSVVSIFNTRQVEFGIERPYAGRTVSAGSIVGPPGPRTWLRVSRTTDAAGEVELTGWSSQDGDTWLRGATWTLPAGSTPQVGLGAHGTQPGGPAAEVSFDHLRWYTP